MPSTGSPDSNTQSGVRGVPISVTLAGLPESMTARGLTRSSALSARLNGTISEYTPASRTRRAMSWVTWEPKSMMRTVSVMDSGYDKREAAAMSAPAHAIA